MKHKRHRVLFLAASGLALGPVPASAETLMDALVKAYRFNPTLNGNRATQRAIDEDVALAKANGRPAAEITGTYSEQIKRTPQITFLGGVPTQIQTIPKRSVDGQAQLSVPLYNSGTVRNAISAAKLRVEAGKGNLRGAEATIFSQVVSAYMNVLRDSQVVLFNEQNVRSLDVNLRASSDRFQVGDLTRTDVAQSDSRLALALAQLHSAEAQLIASKENYTALVGTPPVDLLPPPPLPGLPQNLEGAVSLALTDNPDIIASQKSRDAARYDARAAAGQAGPRVSAFVNGTFVDYLNTELPGLVQGRNKSAAAGATVTLPLYQGGRPAAAQRQAVARESAAIEQATEVERNVISQVRSIYASWQAAQENINATSKAVSATQLALEGVKAENSVGSRTILDILNAEQEALNARVQLVTARRDAYVAAFSLLAAMGHAEGRDLGLDPSILYDADANYQRVRGKFFDYDFAGKPTAVSPSTRDTPAQDASKMIAPGFETGAIGAPPSPAPPPIAK